MKEPPPINYATHPKHRVLLSSSTSVASARPALGPESVTTSSRTSSSGPLAVVAIDQDWLDSIIHSTPALPPAFFTQGPTNPSSTMDGHDPSIQSLADTLDCLSTDDATQPQAAVPASALQPPPSPSVQASPGPVATQRHRQKSKAKFYSVTAGKRCGVFQGWSYVQPLVIGVSESCYTVFKTYEDAASDYARAKAAKLVKVLRNPGDELIFGPLSTAVM